MNRLVMDYLKEAEIRPYTQERIRDIASTINTVLSELLDEIADTAEFKDTESVAHAVGLCETVAHFSTIQQMVLNKEKL